MKIIEGYRPSQTGIVLGATFIIALILSVTLKGFFSTGNLFAMLRSISILGIFGIGMAVVVIGKGIDLSQIAIASVCAAGSIIMINAGYSVVWSLLAGFVIATGIGVLNGFLISFVEIPALFSTLASGLFTLGVMRSTYVPAYVVFLSPEHKELLRFGGNIANGLPVPVLIFSGSALLLHLFLSKTVWGRYIYAHGDNADAARLTGIAVRPLTMLEYALSLGIGYIAAILMVASTGLMHLQIAEGTLIYDVILVVVLGGVSLIGGRGGVMGVIAGTLLVGVIRNAMTIMDIDSQTQNILMGIVLLMALIIDSILHPRDDETAKQGD